MNQALFILNKNENRNKWSFLTNVRNLFDFEISRRSYFALSK